MYNNKYDILGSTIKPNPASVKYWADLASNPNGGDLKYFKEGNSDNPAFHHKGTLATELCGYFSLFSAKL